MSATTDHILSQAELIEQLIEANPMYASLNDSERFFYRMALLDVSTMLINNLMPCTDLDIDSVGSCVDAITDWHAQLFTLNRHLNQQQR